MMIEKVRYADLLKKLAEKYESNKHLASRLSVTDQTVRSWLKKSEPEMHRLRVTSLEAILTLATNLGVEITAFVEGIPHETIKGELPAGIPRQFPSLTNARLRAEVSRQARAEVAKRGLSVLEAAAQLRISRQALHRILAGTVVPSAEVLLRMIRLWDLRISVSGMTMGGLPGSGRFPIEISSKSALYLFNAKRMRVFLCHATEDKPRVRVLYQRLVKSGFTPWLDVEDLVPGQDWDHEIKQAVRTSDIVLVCLSMYAIRKSGYVQKEIAHALDAAEEKPEATIFVIPVLLEPCDVPSRLKKWHWVNLRTRGGYARLVRALETRFQQLKPPDLRSLKTTC